MMFNCNPLSTSDTEVSQNMQEDDATASIGDSSTSGRISPQDDQAQER